METKIWSVLKEINIEIPDDFAVNLLELGLIDSFDIVNLVAKLEAAFAVEIEPEDIVPENFATINAMSRLIKKYLDSSR